jgi:hypothetical protein
MSGSSPTRRRRYEPTPEPELEKKQSRSIKKETPTIKDEPIGEEGEEEPAIVSVAASSLVEVAPAVPPPFAYARPPVRTLREAIEEDRRGSLTAMWSVTPTEGLNSDFTHSFATITTTRIKEGNTNAVAGPSDYITSKNAANAQAYITPAKSVSPIAASRAGGSPTVVNGASPGSSLRKRKRGSDGKSGPRCCCLSGLG